MKEMIENQFDVKIEFEMYLPDSSSVTRSEFERQYMASNSLPDVISLASLSPQEQYNQELTRSLPRKLIEKHMEGYSELLSADGAWPRLMNPDENDTQLALGGYLYERRLDLLFLAVRRQLAGAAFDTRYDTEGSADDLKDHLGQNGLISIEEIEKGLLAMSKKRATFWIGRPEHLVPLSVYFGLHTVGGSIIFGYDSETGEINLDSDSLEMLFDKLQQWYASGYIHDKHLLKGTWIPPKDEVHNVGMMTVRSLWIGKLYRQLPPLSWIDDEDADIITLMADNVVSKAATKSLFIERNIDHETINIRVDNQDDVVTIMEIFEHVRVFLDDLDKPRYWREWIYGVEDHHYSLYSGGRMVPNTNGSVTDSRFAPFLHKDHGRDSMKPAQFHFKTHPLFSTEATAQYDYDRAFIRHMEDYVSGRESLSTYKSDQCGVLPLIDWNVRLELNLIRKVITNEMSVSDLRADYLGIVSEAISACNARAS